MRCRTCVIVFAVLFVSFAYYAYDPFPENTLQPEMLRIYNIIPKIVNDIGFTVRSTAKVIYGREKRRKKEKPGKKSGEEKGFKYDQQLRSFTDEKSKSRRRNQCRFTSSIGYNSFHNCSRAIINFVERNTPTPEDDDLEVADTIFDGISVRLYKPRDANRPLPGIVFIHGGGWVLFSKETPMYDRFARHVSRNVRAVVVSIGYRKAPENKYPAAFDDCLKAVKYFMENARSFNVDPERIGITGDSAGGNLAMAVSLKLSDIGFLPQLKLQGLIYPALQMVDFNTPSYISSERQPFILNKHLMVDFWLNYAFGSTANIEAYKQNNHTTQTLRSVMDKSLLPDKYRRTIAEAQKTDKFLYNKVKSHLDDKYLAPLMCSDKDLMKLPKTYLLTCEFDPLRDEGIILAERMRKLKMPIMHKHWEGTFHAFMISDFLLDIQKVALSKFIDYLKSEL